MKSWPRESRVAYSAERRVRCVVAVAEAKLVAAPAGTRLIGFALCVLGRNHRHHLGRRSSPLQQPGHGPHHRARVREEELQALTEVVLPLLAVAREREPVFRAATVAKMSDIATLALRGQRVALVVTEAALFGRRHQLQPVRL